MAASLFKWFAVYAFLFSYNGSKNKFEKEDVLKHPLYVTVTEINHNAKDKTLEVSCKIFTNDFEGALEKTLNTKIDLAEPKDKAAADKLVNDYIVKHLQIKVDGKPVTLQFVGSEKEKETEATWTYFQVNNIPSAKKVDIFNNLLYESFNNEINLIHITVMGNRKSTKLDYPATNAEFEF
jgi:uncharacterized protein DUF6702